jgi:type IV pilus assembly protein PilP
MKKFLILVGCALLTACTIDGDYEDLRQWMNDASKDLKGKVTPLPQVKPYESVAYDVGNMVDPFKSSKIIPDKVNNSSGIQPDRDRPREPLESYPLESLKYVGVMTLENKQPSAIILADSALYQVKAGNYLGQNFGVITQISEDEVVLKELVQDDSGGWIEQVSSLQLQGQEGTK